MSAHIILWIMQMMHCLTQGHNISWGSPTQGLSSASSPSKKCAWGGGCSINKEVRTILQAQKIQGNLNNQEFGGINLDIPKPFVNILFFSRRHPGFGIANLSPLGV